MIGIAKMRLPLFMKGTITFLVEISNENTIKAININDFDVKNEQKSILEKIAQFIIEGEN